jgi:hypothetical protein
MSTLGSKYGYEGMLPQSVGQLLVWAVYHASVDTGTFYRDNDEGTKRCVGVFLRGLNHVVSIFLNIMSFVYADLAHIN